jgi:hypothetical protein
VSTLARISSRDRQRMALLFLGFGALVLVMGLLPMITKTGVAWRVVGSLLLVLAALLFGMTIGLKTSVDKDAREAEIDAAVMAISGPCGTDCGTGGCGVQNCAVQTLPRR